VNKKLKDFLDQKVIEYNTPAFIENDPISVPHLFTKKQDIEIAAFFASVFAWGKRNIIINKSRELMQLMENAPYDFILNHKEGDLKKLLNYKHRTFNVTDLLYFIMFLKYHYNQSKTLETAFSNWIDKNDHNVEKALTGFHRYFFSIPDAPARTRKHVATPERGSTCKRLNMFLRWMVRKDDKGVDFGIWNKIEPSQLLCPIDMHVARVAKRINLINRKQVDWLSALELTDQLKKFDREDPAKYDFALFGLGVVEQF
jgi:uncharacterized protein (TIGR02757 family)